MSYRLEAMSMKIVTPEKAIELVREGRTGFLMTLVYWLNDPDAPVDPENLGIRVQTGGLTLSPEHTPNISLVGDILVTDAYFPEELIPEPLRKEENRMEWGGFRVSVRIPKWAIMAILFPAD